jgi:hypothetical protein
VTGESHVPQLEGSERRLGIVLFSRARALRATKGTAHADLQDMV